MSRTSPTYDPATTVFELRDISPVNQASFRLYHSNRGCYLATTFRRFPESADGPHTNDTILSELRVEVEAGCVRLAHERASRFHIIEGELDTLTRVATNPVSV